jgi:hypothetical protein
MTTTEIDRDTYNYDGVILGCPECRADAGLRQPQGAPHQWYLCPTCGEEWREDGPSPWKWPHPVDVLFTGIWLAFMGASLVGVIVLIARGAVENGWVSRTSDDISPMLLVALLVGFVSWAIAMSICASLFEIVQVVLARGLRYVWGESLPWATSPRCP